MSHKDAKEVLQERFKALSESPKDRLDCLNKIFQLRAAINLSLIPLNVLIVDEALATEYTKEELELIYEHLCAAAEPVKELYEHFIEQAKRFAEKTSFAI